MDTVWEDLLTASVDLVLVKVPDVSITSFVLVDHKVDIILAVVVSSQRSPQTHVICVQGIGFDFSSNLKLNDLEAIFIGPADDSSVI